jgi:hypothetical protein
MDNPSTRPSLRRQTRRPAARERGQVVVIFAMSIVLFVGMCGVVVDIAWYWANMLRMQRAADAAALAGVVYLPGNLPTAITAAKTEATKNGYTDGVGGTTVTVAQDVANNRSLRVTINGSSGTFFMRLFGIGSIAGQRRAKAEYVLPVPMGSPDSFYGVFGTLRTPAGGHNESSTTSGVTDFLLASSSPSGNWTNPAYAQSSTDANASATKNSTTNPYQAWGGFNIAPPGTGTLSVTGIEVQARASATVLACVVGVSLSYNGSAVGGTGWTAAQNFTTTSGSTFTYYPTGGLTSTWGRTWTEAQLNNTNFRVRLQYTGTGCAGSTVSVDSIWVRVAWTRTTTTWVPDAAITGPSGEALPSRGFWGTMLTQGAADINGDAYLPYYETPTSVTNPDYQPTRFYDYAVYMPPGSTGGELSIFDPVFCGTDGSADYAGRYGTGDRWFSSGTSAVSAFYTLWDTNDTLYDSTDDTLVVDSGTLFRRVQALDSTLFNPATTLPTGASSCTQGAVTDTADGRYWHNRWWSMTTSMTGGSDGRTYRLRTSTTDPNSATDQRNSNAMNSYALFASASGGSPRIYGLGSMESYTPLPGGSASTFYLAQIDAVHAGKTVVISLWDPGDTGTLSATVQILLPGTSGYTAASVKWSSAKGTTNGSVSACNGLTGTGTSITANTGTSQKFNGCWVTIEVPIPATYTAPTPPGETEPGWWKIKYTIGGTSSDTSFDVTTWQVAIRGNPVHLVLP